MFKKSFLFFFALLYGAIFLSTPTTVKAVDGFGDISPSTVFQGGLINYQVTVNGLGGDISAAVYYILASNFDSGNGWNILRTFTTNQNGPPTYSWNTSGITPGTYRIGLFLLNNGTPGQMVDSSGNLSIQSCPSSAPALTSPIDSAVLSSPSVVLRWSGSGFDKYYVTVNDNGAGTVVDYVDNGSSTSYNFTATEGHQYNWQINGTKSDGSCNRVSTGTGVFSVTAETVPGDCNLSTDGNFNNIHSMQEITWTNGRMRLCKNEWLSVPVTTAGMAKIYKISAKNLSSTENAQFAWDLKHWYCDLLTNKDTDNTFSCADRPANGGTVQTGVRTASILPGYTVLLTSGFESSLSLQQNANDSTKYCGVSQNDMVTVRLNGIAPGPDVPFWAFARSNEGCPPAVTITTSDNTCTATPPTQNIQAGWNALAGARGYIATLYTAGGAVGASSCIPYTDSNPTSYTFANRATNQTYTVGVTGYSDTACSLLGSAPGNKAVTNACTGGGGGLTVSTECYAGTDPTINPSVNVNTGQVIWRRVIINDSSTSYDYTWNFGLASGYNCITPSPNCTSYSSATANASTITYSSIGSKTATLRVVGNSGYDSGIINCSNSVTVTDAGGGGSQPDLVVDSTLPTSAVAGSSVTFSGRVVNQGSASAGASSTRLRLASTAGGALDTTLTNQNAGILAANGGNQTVTWTSSWTATGAGIHQFEICADTPANAVTESNVDGTGETNNCTSGNINVTAAPVFDFSLSSPADITITQNGSAGSNTFTVNKIGTATSEIVAFSIDPATPLPAGTGSGTGATWSFTPPIRCNPGCSGTNTLTITPNTAVTASGGISVRIRGVSQPADPTTAITRYSTPFTLIINPQPGGLTTPWIQTVGGDVHSNTKINTPGGP